MTQPSANRSPVGTPDGKASGLTWSPAQYRAFVEATSDAVWSWSPSRPPSQIESTQAWWAEITGQTIEQQRAHPDAWLEVVHPEDRERARREWSAATAKGVAYDIEYRVRARDGSWRYVHLRGVPVAGPDGTPQEWIGSLKDTTSERTSHLWRQRRFFESVLAHSADYLYLFDLEGRFVYANQPLLDLWELAERDVLGKTFRDLHYPHELAERLLGQIADVIRTKSPSRGEASRDRKGVSRTYEYIFAPVIAADGTVEGVAGSTRDITERVAAEREMRASEQRYRVLATASMDVVYRMSADWSEMLPLDGRGLVASNAEPIRGWMEKNVPAFEHERLRRAIQHSIATKSVFEVEHQVIRPDGSLGWTSSRAVPILDSAGAIVEWFGTARDTTARHENEAELRDIKSRMEAALEAGTIGTWSWDVQADRFRGDASFARIFGVRPAEVAGGPIAPIVERIHPDDRSRVMELVAKTIESGSRYETTYRVLRQDGNWRWVNARGQIERDAQGRAVKFPGVVIDVTEQKIAVDALARVTSESEKRRRLYETILSNTPDFAYVIGLDRRFVYANERLLTMWGRTWDETVGRTFFELGYEPWHAEMHEREIEQVKTTKKPIRGEVPFHGTFGRRIYDYIFVPVFGENGEVEAIAGTTRDVTDRKQAEEAVRDADRKKDDFIALLAHELRNPLAPIRNGLSILRHSADKPAELARAREMMERQLAHMVRLIDDLLDVSRVTRNKLELRKSRVQLSGIISDAVEAVMPLAEEAGQTITVSLGPTPIWLDADTTRLAQVFSNLLSNSVKFTPRGGRISISGEVRGTEVVVNVRDTGIGIPKFALGAIFDMFSQVDRVIDRSKGGLGIGLALVKGLVEMHGGSVHVESVEGTGSTFSVRLPLASAPAMEPSAPVPTTASTPQQVRRRVLVVDDSVDNAHSMAALLRVMGNEVAMAHDGAAAIASADSFRPDFILMDVGLPEINGLEATRHIRQREWGKGITIIALTGWGQESDRKLTREAGCDGHLVKPVDFGELEKLLSEPRAQRAR